MTEIMTEIFLLRDFSFKRFGQHVIEKRTVGQKCPPVQWVVGVLFSECHHKSKGTGERDQRFYVGRRIRKK